MRRSPSSEAAQNVVVFYFGWNSIRERPSSPEPSYLNKLIYMNGFQMKSTIFLRVSFSTSLVSHIHTIPSSDTERKNGDLFSAGGFFLSILTPEGMKATSLTKFLWDITILDMAKCFSFITLYYAIYYRLLNMHELNLHLPSSSSVCSLIYSAFLP